MRDLLNDVYYAIFGSNELMQEGTVDRKAVTAGINKLLRKTLSNIKLIIENGDYTDAECVEYIMQEFEDIKSPCLISSIREREEKLKKVQKILINKEKELEWREKFLEEDSLIRRENYLKEKLSSNKIKKND